MKAFFKAILLISGLMIFMIYLWVDTEHQSQDYTVEDISRCTDVDAEDTVLMRYSHGRGWIEYLNNTDFCSLYDVSFGDVGQAETNRNNMVIEYWYDDADYWRQVYSRLYLDNKDQLVAIQDSLLKIKQERNLDRDAFATMVVAFVQ